MQNIVSSCAVSMAAGFIQNVPNNTINWASISPVAGSTVHSFGKAAQNKGAKQIIGANINNKKSFFYVSSSLTLANMAQILTDPISADQVASSMSKAAASVGSGGFINMATISMKTAAAAANGGTELCCCVNGKCTASCKTLAASCASGTGQCVQASLCPKQPPVPPPAPQPTILVPASLGLSASSLLMPMCGGQPNWLSIGTYVALVALLILLWWFFFRGNI